MRRRVPQREKERVLLAWLLQTEMGLTEPGWLRLPRERRTGWTREQQRRQEQREHWDETSMSVSYWYDLGASEVDLPEPECRGRLWC